MVVNERPAKAASNVRKVENIFEDKNIFWININEKNKND